MADPAPKTFLSNPAPGESITSPANQRDRWVCDRYEIKQSLSPRQHQVLGSVRTFLAWDHKNQSNVVLKALPFGKLQGWKPLEHFEQEARSLAQLNHPAIPRYLDYLEHRSEDDPATTFYLVQSYVEGISLGQCVRRGDRFSEAATKAIARQGLEILNYLHSLSPPLVHRDIKPDNLICSSSSIDEEHPQISLVDFGAVQAAIHQGSTVIGTYGYMAPEQFRGQARTASDLYSFGATLLNLLTHQEPIDLPSQRLRIDFRSILNLSEDFADWLDGLLAPMVGDRFASAQQALEALDNPALIAGYLNKAQASAQSIIPAEQYTSHEITNSFACNLFRPDLAQPSNSAIRLQRHSGSYPLGQPSLTLDIPPIGLKRELSALAGFALLWNGGLLYWLIMAWVMDAPWYYPIASAPLWCVGLLLMGRLGKSFFGQVRLVVEADEYCLEQRLGPLKQEKRGPLSDWQSIGLRQQYSKGGEAVDAIALVLGLETVEFGVMLSEAEKQWLVSELQNFLSDIEAGG